MRRKPKPSFINRWSAIAVLAVTAGLRAESPVAPPVFTEADDAEAAYQKIVSFAYSPDVLNPSAMDTPAGRQAYIRLRWIQAMEYLQVRLACLDFYARFPESPRYADLRGWEAGQLVVTGKMLEDKLRNGSMWIMADGARDPHLSEDTRVMFALYRAEDDARSISQFQGVPLADARLREVAAIAQKYKGNEQARQALMRLGLEMMPDRRGIEELRRVLPDDPEATAFIRLVEGIGQPCDFDFIALDGRRVRAADYRGKVVFLEFWAKWCSPCVQSIPALKRSSEDHASAGFAVIGVNLDASPAEAESIIKEHALPWPQHFDGKGWKNEMARRFFVTSIPHGVVVDRQGRLRSLNCDLRFPDGQKLIEALLAEAPPSAAPGTH